MKKFSPLKITQAIYTTILSVLAVWLLASCSSEETGYTPDPTKPADDEVLLVVRVPGNSLPYTRSIAGAGGEAKITSLDVLVFDDQPLPVLIDHSKATITSQSESEPDKYRISFNVTVPGSSSSRTIAVIANASEAVNSAIYSGSSLNSMNKNEVLSALVFSTPGSTPDDFKWKANSPSDYTPIPMYGEITVNGISGGTAIDQTINLTRMLARIDIKNNSTLQFTLQEVYLVNYNTAGYISPAWNSSNGALESQLPDNPMLPPNPGKKPGTSMRITYPYDNSSGNGSAGEIYTYEALRASATDETQRRDAACLIVKGVLLSDNRDYYYRIDFTEGKDGDGNHYGDPNFNPSTVNYMPLYRNHKYLIDISAVNGIGYATFDEALASLSVLSNMKSKLLVVDDSDITDVVYNGQYYLGTQSLEQIGYPGGAILVKVVTDYPDGWSLDTEIYPDGVQYLSGSGWITGITQGGENELLFNVSGRQQTDGSNTRSAIINLKAGRLHHTVEISQAANTGSGNAFAFSNIVFKDGILTFAESSANDKDIPSNAQGVFFKYGSLVALSSAGTTFSVIYSPPEYPGNLSTWSGVPYHPSNINDGNHSRDEFRDTFPKKGYDETTGKGDICRYMSDHGWVSGHWRTPKISEYEQLYSVTTGTTSGYKGIRVGSFPTEGQNITDQNGVQQINSGWFQGEGASNGSSSNISSPPANAQFFPASGVRDYQTGNLVTPGRSGFYWSSTPNNTTNGYHILFSPSGITRAAGLDRQYGFAVRCITDESPLFWIEAQGFTDGNAGSTYTATIKANGTWTATITSGAQHITSYTQAGSANADGTPFRYTFSPSGGSGSVTFRFQVESGETATVTVGKN